MASHDAKPFLKIVSLVLCEFRERSFNAYRVQSQYKSDRNNFVNDFNTFVIATVEKVVFNGVQPVYARVTMCDFPLFFVEYPRISQMRK